MLITARSVTSVDAAVNTFVTEANWTTESTL